MLGLPGISPESVDMTSGISVAYYKSHLWRNVANTAPGAYSSYQRKTGQLPCHDFCFQGCLIKRLVAFSTGESLNEGLCSLPGLIQCQSLWLWSASAPNPSLEGWLAAVDDSSKFLSRLYKTDFISFWLLLCWCFTKFSQWIFSVLALCPCGFYIHFLYQ